MEKSDIRHRTKVLLESIPPVVRTYDHPAWQEFCEDADAILFEINEQIIQEEENAGKTDKSGSEEVTAKPSAHRCDCSEVYGCPYAESGASICNDGCYADSLSRGIIRKRANL